MPLSPLDPKTALIVIDLQKGVLSRPAAHPIAEIVERSAALARAFRARGLPVVLVNVGAAPSGRTEERAALLRASGEAAVPRQFPAEWMKLVAELEQQPDDLLVTKHSWGAFTGTGLEAALTALGVTEVVLTGVATSAGVESTARNAHELGFTVVLAVDAMTDRSVEAHEHSVTRIFPRIGETATTAEILAALG